MTTAVIALASRACGGIRQASIPLCWLFLKNSVIRHAPCSDRDVLHTSKNDRIKMVFADTGLCQSKSDIQLSDRLEGYKL